MALDADVVRLDVVQASGIDDVRARGFGGVLGARPVALLTAYVPFGDTLRFDVVVYGVAAVASRSGGTGGVGLRVVFDPPVSAGGDVVRPPYLMGDVPLCGQREVVVSDSLEV